MNGFISGLGKGLLSAAAVTVAALGCNLLERHCAAGLFSKKSRACSDGMCGQSGCSSCKGGLGKGKDFDYEQLHGDHCWPQQYTRESYRRVQAPFYQQMVNGLEVETTIWAHYFSTEKGKEHLLSEVGESRLSYLARKRPFVVPTLHLQTSFDANLDEQRINSVIEAARKVSVEPIAWNVVLNNRRVPGLYGPEAPKEITKMIGPGGGPPAYEPQIKREFLTGSSVGGGT